MPQISRTAAPRITSFRRLLLATLGSIAITTELAFDITSLFNVAIYSLFTPLVFLSGFMYLNFVYRYGVIKKFKVPAGDYFMAVLSIALGALILVISVSDVKFVIPPEIFLFYFYLFFAIEFNRNNILGKSLIFKPQLLFALSFLALIFLGTILLKLPRSTYQPISLIDALFTSVSAVSVTGLITLDTGKDFTLFGQIVILLLIQLGGLGVMTFTSFFGFFFKGQTSIEDQLTLRDLTNSTLRNARAFVIRVVLFTLGIELVGAALIYFSLSDSMLPNSADAVWFSVFHSVSAFCNAGFSTLTNGLFEGDLQYNYAMQWVLMWLIVTGGIGFFIVFNFYNYIKSKVVYFIRGIFTGSKKSTSPWILNLSSRLILGTTASLILFGLIAYFWFEQSATLEAHTTSFGKFTVSMFGSITPRTAGFNIVNIAEMATPTIMVYLLLMWIGASPGGTGGGIKTTIFSLALLNIYCMIRGKKRIEFGGREVGQTSINQSFAVIFLSVFYLGLIVTLLLNIEPELRLLPIAFECFSAMSTVGLSMGITPHLSDASKLVLGFTMYFGRVGLFVILSSLAKQVKEARYQYPKEEIVIN